MLNLAERKGVPVHVIGGPQKKPAGVNRTADPEEPDTRRGLPDWAAAVPAVRVGAT